MGASQLHAGAGAGAATGALGGAGGVRSRARTRAPQGSATGAPGSKGPRRRLPPLSRPPATVRLLVLPLDVHAAGVSAERRLTEEFLDGVPPEWPMVPYADARLALDLCAALGIDMQEASRGASRRRAGPGAGQVPQGGSMLPRLILLDSGGRVQEIGPAAGGAVMGESASAGAGAGLPAGGQSGVTSAQAHAMPSPSPSSSSHAPTDPMLRRVAEDPEGFPWVDLRPGRQTPLLPLASQLQRQWETKEVERRRRIAAIGTANPGPNTPRKGAPIAQAGSAPAAAPASTGAVKHAMAESGIRSSGGNAPL